MQCYLFMQTVLRTWSGSTISGEGLGGYHRDILTGADNTRDCKASSIPSRKLADRIVVPEGEKRAVFRPIFLGKLYFLMYVRLCTASRDYDVLSA